MNEFWFGFIMFLSLGGWGVFILVLFKCVILMIFGGNFVLDFLVVIDRIFCRFL